MIKTIKKLLKSSWRKLLVSTYILSTIVAPTTTFGNIEVAYAAPPVADTVAPSVAISGISSGDTVSGVVAPTITYTDNEEVRRYYYYLKNSTGSIVFPVPAMSIPSGNSSNTTGEGSPTGLWVVNLSINTALLPDGTYTLVALVDDKEKNGFDFSDSIFIGTSSPDGFTYTTWVSFVVNNSEVDPVDETAPVITLTGLSELDVFQGDTYTDQGATALDDIDGDITASIVVTNPVDTSVLGTYTVRYNVSDSAGNSAVEVTRTVNVIPNSEEEDDTTPPVITLIGLSELDVFQGDTYTDQGATALDDVDGDISASIVVTNPVDTSVLGTYTVRYNVDDSAGNSAVEVTRTVNVIPNSVEEDDTTPPVISLIGGNIQITQGQTYVDQGATAFDDEDGDITASIVATSTVNTSVQGTYTVRYNVSDSAGNAADEVTRTVVVVAPVIVPLAPIAPIVPVVPQAPVAPAPAFVPQGDVQGAQDEDENQDEDETTVGADNGDVRGETCTEVKLFGYVYFDENKNGKFDKGEEVFADVEVVVKDSNGKVIETLETDEDGRWETSLCAGNYAVEVSKDTVENGYKLVKGAYDIELSEDDKELNVSFALVEQKSLLDYWWLILLALLLLVGGAYGYKKYKESN